MLLRLFKKSYEQVEYCPIPNFNLSYKHKFKTFQMITENKRLDKDKPYGGLENDVPQNHGVSQEEYTKETNEKSGEKIGKPVNNGGVNTMEYNPQLEEQWLAVRDEYLSHYPDLEVEDTVYKKGSFYSIIDSIAESRKSTPKEIHDEIMGWPTTG